MDLYIVFDTKGSGRVLGVFDVKDKAEDIVSRFPHYYALHVAKLNRINSEVVEWADSEEQKETLAELVDTFGSY